MIRLCQCGHTPILVHGKLGDTRSMRLMCVCGIPCGAVVTYKKPADAERTRQALIDGWNFADQCAFTERESSQIVNRPNGAAPV